MSTRIHIAYTTSMLFLTMLLWTTHSSMKEHTNKRDEVIRYRDRRQLINRPFTLSDKNLTSIFRDLIEKKAEPLNEQLLSLAREIIEPPSNHTPKTRTTPVTPQITAVMRLLNKKRGGFFIECGANNGETSSNTLYLEKLLGWTGLLVETDHFLYTQLLSKSRNSHTINACMGTSRHPSMVEITDSAIGGGRMLPDGQYRQPDVRFGARLGGMAPCFPLDTLLVAMGTYHVDYFSLDVEGYELDILRTISWDKFTIDVISVEYIMIQEGKEALRRYMEGLGYVTYDDITFRDPPKNIYVTDYIFVSKDILKKSGLKTKLKNL